MFDKLNPYLFRKITFRITKFTYKNANIIFI